MGCGDTKGIYLMIEKKHHILYVVSHPIQYQAPLLRLIENSSDINVTALFYWDKKTEVHFDEGFGRKVKWDVPLLSGYDYHYLNDAAKSKNTLQKLKTLWKIIHSKKYNIVWTHGYADLYTLFSIFFAKLSGVSVFVRGESLFFKEDKKDFKRKLFFKVLDKFVDRYLAIGTNNKNFYLQNRIAENKIYICNYSVDNNFFREKYFRSKIKILELKFALHLDPIRPVILYASKFIKRKHPIDVLDAFLILPKSNIRPYLLFIGSGETLGDVKKKAEKADPDSIRFLGFKNQSELPDYYALADILVLPSERENWGLVVNEAMNAECAIVLSDQVGCAVDLVRSSENGYIFPARDVVALSQKLNTLITDQQLLEKMKIKSVEIISQWGLQQSATGLQNACESLCVE